MKITLSATQLFFQNNTFYYAVAIPFCSGTLGEIPKGVHEGIPASISVNIPRRIIGAISGRILEKKS